MMFNDKVKHKSEQLFEITNPIIEDLEESSKLLSIWCNKDGYEISKEGVNYVIHLDMPTSNDSAL
ncbi:MAG: hypothetical protein V3581_00430 [Candidatus Cardinium sp.]|uniref:hypothetical protein n=1 Tax=Candidatus Cardinium sp. TP TaxID=2961955 RepID=UPI0021AE8E56|nr:hypothetical protein [Candidatus Cardinium sp. TP]MCT4697441.1 hypothetical protein [Candidatus Cardinium sp. TP]MDN5246726.1 hypothetical protein [Candidatus Cardinium sp.]